MRLGEIVKLLADISKAKISHSKIPVRVKHNITYRCNLSCHFCLLKNQLDKPCGCEMDTNQIKKMMKEFKEMGTKFWLFSGGEPLLRKDLGELISYAKEVLNFHCSIATNGILLTERIKDDPSLKQLDLIQISLEGPKEIQDGLRGRGTYDKIILALDALKESKIKAVIIVLLSKYNIEHLHCLIKLAAQYNTGIMFQAIGSLPAATPGLKESFFPPQDILKKVANELTKEGKKNRFIVSSFEYLNMLRDYWPDTSHKIRCYAGQFYCDVTPEGCVIPCCAKSDAINQSCNGLALGFKKAFLQIDKMDKCRDCYYAGPQELNILFGMAPLRMLHLLF